MKQIMHSFLPNHKFIKLSTNQVVCFSSVAMHSKPCSWYWGTSPGPLHPRGNEGHHQCQLHMAHLTYKVPCAASYHLMGSVVVICQDRLLSWMFHHKWKVDDADYVAKSTRNQLATHAHLLGILLIMLEQNLPFKSSWCKLIYLYIPENQIMALNIMQLLCPAMGDPG